MVREEIQIFDEFCQLIRDIILNEHLLIQTNHQALCCFYFLSKHADPIIVPFRIFDTDICTCVSFLLLVPVKDAYIVGVNSSVSRTIENNATRFTCKTTPSYPAPNVTWYYELAAFNTKEIDKENITTSQKKPEEYHLISVESNLRLIVSRRFNGTRIYCTARNGFGNEPFVSSSRLQILVQCKNCSHLLIIK